MSAIEQSIVDRAWSVAGVLAADAHGRVAGTARERAAADAIVAAFQERGLAVQREPFRFVGWEAEGQPAVTLSWEGHEHVALPVSPMPYTGSTPPGGVSGRLVEAGVCELVPGLLEWPRYAVEDAEGRWQAFVAVVPDGPTRSFPRPERQLLLEPIVIAGSDAFAPVAEALAAGQTVHVTLTSQGRYVSGLESENIIAELPGSEPGVIVVSAHYDSVLNTPGAGDNASGVAGCLALAEYFTQHPVSKTLRFICWGAHEFGLLGSQYHLQERAQRRAPDEIEAAIALDILSDGDRIGVWSGDEVLSAELDDLLTPASEGYPVEQYPRGRGETDSWSFAERGIDTVMVLTLPYAHFHLPSDTIENNDPQLFRASLCLTEEIIRHLDRRNPRPKDC
jgi:aminopeptidase YwaD